MEDHNRFKSSLFYRAFLFLIGMKIEVFSTEVTGSAVQDNRMAITLVPFLGMPMIVLLLLFLFFLYFGYSYRQ